MILRHSAPLALFPLRRSRAHENVQNTLFAYFGDLTKPIPNTKLQGASSLFEARWCPPSKTPWYLDNGCMGTRDGGQGETYLAGFLANMLQIGPEVHLQYLFISGSEENWTLGKYMQVAPVFRSG